jgi:chromosome segregation ATPase
LLLNWKREWNELIEKYNRLKECSGNDIQKEQTDKWRGMYFSYLEKVKKEYANLLDVLKHRDKYIDEIREKNEKNEKLIEYLQSITSSQPHITSTIDEDQRKLINQLNGAFCQLTLENDKLKTELETAHSDMSYKTNKIDSLEKQIEDMKIMAQFIVNSRIKSVRG